MVQPNRAQHRTTCSPDCFWNADIGAAFCQKELFLHLRGFRWPQLSLWPARSVWLDSHAACSSVVAGFCPERAFENLPVGALRQIVDEHHRPRFLE